MPLTFLKSCEQKYSSDEKCQTFLGSRLQTIEMNKCQLLLQSTRGMMKQSVIKPASEESNALPLEGYRIVDIGKLQKDLNKCLFCGQGTTYM